MNFLLQVSGCGYSEALLPRREGEVWWSFSAAPPLSGDQLHYVRPITDTQLQDWISDTVGWHALEITADALRAAGSHYTQAKALIQASLEAAARAHTRRCRFSQVDLDQSLGRCLGTALVAYPNIEVLALRELNVYDEAVPSLAKGLEESERLRKLSLRQVDLSGNGWAGLLGALPASSVQILKIRQSLGPAAVLSLAQFLPTMRITRLDVSSNELGDWGLARLCEGLIRSVTIAHLLLNDNKLGAAVGTGSRSAPSKGPVGAGTLLAELLRRTSSLRILDLGDNPLGPQACAEVAQGLASAPRLVALRMRRCGADDACVDAVCRALQQGHGLASLDLGGGRVSSAGAQQLATCCQRGKLQTLSLAGNCMLETEGVQAFARALQSPTCPLQSLNLSECEAGDDAAVALAEALSGGGAGRGDGKGALHLSRLDLASNSFTIAGIAALVSSLQYNTHMCHLDLSFNWAGPQAIRACLEGLRKKTLGQGRTHVCEVQAEVSEEFRLIEKIKAGDFRAAEEEGAMQRGQQQEQQGTQQRQQGTAPQASRANPFPEVPVTEPHSAAAAAESPAIASLSEGYQIPVGLVGRGSCASVGSSWSSCMRLVRSGCSSLAGDDDGRRQGEVEGELREAKADGEQCASRGSGEVGDGGEQAGQGRQRQSAACVAAWSPSAVVRATFARGLEKKLQGCEDLMDGTFNLELPVSFPAAQPLHSRKGSATLEAGGDAHQAAHGDGRAPEPNPFAEGGHGHGRADSGAACGSSTAEAAAGAGAGPKAALGVAGTRASKHHNHGHQPHGHHGPSGPWQEAQKEAHDDNPFAGAVSEADPSNPFASPRNPFALR